MVEYYTKGGTIINNPAAYAKTGAPMYNDRYQNGNNINETTYIYKLNLENNKKYIGKTTNIDRRMHQHFNGKGSMVTKKFAPKDGEIVEVCNGYFSNNAEQKQTNKCIKTHGYQNVRGGKYTNSKTLHKNNYQHESDNEDYESDNEDYESDNEEYESDNEY